jgi:hypothetical protein
MYSSRDGKEGVAVDTNPSCKNAKSGVGLNVDISRRRSAGVLDKKIGICGSISGSMYNLRVWSDGNKLG